MTPSLTTSLSAIESLCRAALELAKEATEGPWESSTVESIGGASIYGDMSSPNPKDRRLVASGTWTNENERCERIVRSISNAECDANTAFIAATRQLAPATAEATLIAIASLRRLKDLSFHGADREYAKSALTSIVATFTKHYPDLIQ